MCFPSIAVALIAGFSQNKPRLLTHVLWFWCPALSCSFVQRIAGGSTINCHDSRARHHLPISRSFQTDFVTYDLLPPGGAVLPWFHPLSYRGGPQPRQQLGRTAPLAGRETQCSQMCNLVKYSRLPLKSTFVCWHIQAFKVKWDCHHRLWVTIGQEDDGDEVILDHSE